MHTEFVDKVSSEKRKKDIGDGVDSVQQTEHGFIISRISHVVINLHTIILITTQIVILYLTL